MSIDRARRLVLERLGSGTIAMVSLHLSLSIVPAWADGADADGHAVSYHGGDRERFKATASRAGLTNLEQAQLLFDLRAVDRTLLDPNHDPEAVAFDVDAVWGREADTNVQLVNGLLTQLRRHSQADYDALLPYVQRVPAVANRLVMIAKRHRGAA